jgi:hypothetical protein
MDTLLNSGNKLCQACNGGGIGFMSPEGLSQTLAEMLAGMCRRRGAGQGNKQGEGQSLGIGGGGGEGDSGDGYSMPGDPLMQAPVYGPDRMAFGGDTSMQGQSASRGKSGQSKPTVTPETANTIQTEATRTTAKRQISLRDVPEQYRDAVRKFYGEDAVMETSSNSNEEAKP